MGGGGRQQGRVVAKFEGWVRLGGIGWGWEVGRGWVAGPMVLGVVGSWALRVHP